MRFTFNTGIYLVLATAIATLVAIDGADQLSVTERVEQAKAEAQSQQILGTLEELARANEAAQSATLNYVVRRSDQELERLLKAEPGCGTEIAHPAEFVAGNAVERRRATRAA